jgi:hypothetical protein
MREDAIDDLKACAELLKKTNDYLSDLSHKVEFEKIRNSSEISLIGKKLCDTYKSKTLYYTRINILKIIASTKKIDPNMIYSIFSEVDIKTSSANNGYYTFSKMLSESKFNYESESLHDKNSPDCKILKTISEEMENLDSSLRDFSKGSIKNKK